MKGLRAYARIFRKAAFAASLLCLLWVLAGTRGTSAQGTPLAVVQIEKLVEIHSPDGLVAGEIRSRGLAFTPTQKILAELQKRGAGQATLQAIRERIPVGTLEIDGSPNSQVTLDGLNRGTTDSQGRMILARIPAGAHTLSVQKPGYYAGHFAITLKSQEYKRYPVSLAWAGGYLSVETEPAGAIIDVPGLGRYTGEVSDLQCPPGSYDLTITRVGMKPETQSVTIAAGKHSSIVVHLLPDPQYFRNQLANAKLMLARGDAQGAIQISKDLSALEANNPDVDSLLAQAYLQVHDLSRFQSAAEKTIADGGDVVLNLVHEHWSLSGEAFHPARLTVTAKTISYDPMGARSRHHAFTVPISDVELAEVTDKTTAGFMVVRHLTPGTFLLHMEVAESQKRGKRMTFYFATGDSRIVRENNIGFLASPPGSSQILSAFAHVIQSTERSAKTK